jgi:hypothetical protein
MKMKTTFYILDGTLCFVFKCTKEDYLYSRA